LTSAIASATLTGTLEGVRQMRFRVLTLVVAAVQVLGASSAAQNITQPTIWASKPDIIAFEKIIQERLTAANTAISQLTGMKGARTIANTVGPFDEAIRQINAASYFSSLMQQVHPDAAFRDRATDMFRKASAAQTELSLNRDVYNALSGLDVSKADSATRYYVKRQLLEFRLAGVDKDEAARARLKKLNDDLTTEQAAFDRNISEDQKQVEATDARELDGLPEDYIDRHKPGLDGKIYVSTNYPDALPALKFAKSDEFRRRLFLAFNTRAYPKNKEVLERMMQTRYEIATTLGYPSWADYNAADKMIRTGENIGEFIQQIDSTARPIAKRELELMLAEKRKIDPNATEIYDYENSFLNELVRRSQYDFDSQQVRPYLPFNEVRQGILDTASTLFHVEFRREDNVSAWHPSVETWDVFDSGKIIGRFYLDMHPRPGKYSHAEMATVLDGIRGKQMPEAILVCNFPEPTATDPGLMEYSDVVTFFHEFGHLMHWILGGQQRWAGISGISMEADFVEAPSEMLEEWMHSPQVLASFARHYKTGEPIPAELVARMNRADAFGRAGWVTQQNVFAAISYDVYRAKPDTVELDGVTTGDREKYSLLKPLAGAHLYAAFPHLGGYSSAYYTYLWDKVIAEDFFSQFDHNNLLAGPAPMRYRRTVLEPGGSVSANDLVRQFLGRRQNMTALQKWMADQFQTSKGGQHN
jgi:thimet oligopeptidase